MSRKIEVLPGIGGSDLVVSPLTSLLVGSGDGVEHVSDWGGDFWGSQSDNHDGYIWQRQADRDELAAALRLHKVVDILTAGVLNSLGGVDEDSIQQVFGLSPSMEIYRLLREQIGDADFNSDSFPKLEKNDIEEAIGKIKAKIEQFEGVSLPGDWQKDLTALADDLHTAIYGHFNSEVSQSAGAPRSRADARAVEVAVGLARLDAQDIDNGSVAGSAANGNGSSFAKIIKGVRAALGEGDDDDEGDDLDIGDLVQRLSKNSDDVSGAVSSSRVAARLPEITGTRLSLTVGEGTDRAELAFYFAPEQGEGIPSDNGAYLAGWYREDGQGYGDGGELTACLVATGDIDFPFDEDVIHRVGTWERLSDRSLLLNVRFAGEPQTLNLRVRASSNAAALGQYYNRDNWDHQSANAWQEWTWQGNSNGDEAFERGLFWREFSDSYWDGDDTNKERFIGSVDSDDRFYVFDDDLDGKAMEDNWAVEGLTPRGWVFDLDYEGSIERWDVEQTRDGIVVEEEGDEEVHGKLQLFVPYHEIPGSC
ncbi:hypothetical protein LRD18_03060 [Halorhodospira halochloris]|uniref:hypothetical protein n=1 Tax=Halorhodospira halochloris TaxID=1052 RepID=UPI001EE87877|nr:hypothetical protein [Halorhodospira halochloris]MCG5529854.1 hypothetical protein [Halorhodospira halochloris]